MVLPLASRFAVLSVDDDEDEHSRKKSAKSASSKKSDAKQVSNQQSKQKLDPKKKVKKVESQPNLQNQPTKSKNKSTSSQRKKKATNVDQWELWKEKDAQLLDGHYESELHQALLLSQLDYEEKKDVYEQMQKDLEQEKKNANAKKKKGNKAQTTMSLSEFNSLPDSLVKQQEGGGGDADISVNGQPEPDPEFFERIRLDAKKVFSNEQAAEKKKAREPFVNDAITIAQFEDQIERRDKEIMELKKEVSKLKEELHDVRLRNKSLCEILGQGEMQDKAEVLVEMERTQKVKDELSNEVERLHALLEQERSKVRSLTNEKAKGKNKKRTASENQ